MIDTWGVAIPGLAMTAQEIPQTYGLIALENPEIGSGPDWAGREYSLIDVAEFHATRIAELRLGRIVVIGMSMGGMITSIIASRFRHLLPAVSSFRYLVTSPNFESSPAITAKMLEDWTKARRGDVDSYKQVLTPFFSPTFAAKNPSVANNYFAYRAAGLNKQSTKSLFRQIDAIRKFDGHSSWSRLDPTEAVVIGGMNDSIFGPTHNAILRELAPSSTHFEIKSLGHMVNLERPDLFQCEIKP